MSLSNDQLRRQNDRYRSHAEPSDKHKAAFREVVTTGSLDETTHSDLCKRLYESFGSDKKDHPVDPWEPTLPTQDEGNGLGKAVSRHYDGIHLHISEKLYHQQPIGVLLRPINDAVRKAGEALITDVCPRSETVESEIMPAKHYKLTIEPTPVWLAKWIGENGYETV